MFNREVSVTNPEAGDFEVATERLQDYLTAPDPTEFAVIHDGCLRQLLPPGQTCTVQAEFRPQSRGTKMVYIMIAGAAGEGTAFVLAGTS